MIFAVEGQKLTLTPLSMQHFMTFDYSDLYQGAERESQTLVFYHMCAQ